MLVLMSPGFHPGLLGIQPLHKLGVNMELGSFYYQDIIRQLTELLE